MAGFSVIRRSYRPLALGGGYVEEEVATFRSMSEALQYAEFCELREDHYLVSYIVLKDDFVEAG